MNLSFGVLINDMEIFNRTLRYSRIEGDMHYITKQQSAVKGLNSLIWLMGKLIDVGIFVHQDMYFRKGWTDKLEKQIRLLPDSWVVAGIVGKDMEGKLCGNFHDMRTPRRIKTNPLPSQTCCIDECCIIVNMRKGFRFYEDVIEGFDLYGTLAVCQAYEMGGTAWVIDAFAEHYCNRSLPWNITDEFIIGLKRIHERFPSTKVPRIGTTALVSGEINPERYDEYLKQFFIEEG